MGVLGLGIVTQDILGIIHALVSGLRNGRVLSKVVRLKSFHRIRDGDEVIQHAVIFGTGLSLIDADVRHRA